MSHDEIVTLQRQIRDIQEILRKGVESDAALKKSFEEYVSEDLKFKEEVKPMLEVFKDASGFTRTLMGIFKFLGVIVAAGGSIVILRVWAYKFLVK